MRAAEDQWPEMPDASPTPRRKSRLGFLTALLALLLLVLGWIYLGESGAPERVHAAPVELTKEQKQKLAIDRFFDGPILSLKIDLEPSEVERLKKDERNYAEGKISDGTKTTKVALKLKGSAGSFQGFDGKPGITLNFDKLKGSDRFHGLKKFHLNNGAQDGTFLHEQIAGEMARKAGVPASRCTHAFVTINDRYRGTYVVKEAFTREFLAAFYKDPSGDLYDGGFCRDLDDSTEKDLGDPKDKRALKELIEACREGDNAKRWERLGKILDVDEFTSFMAMESILCHWDGYNFNRNNYRLYQDATTGKFSFFLHGMDQTLNDPNFPLNRDFGTLVGGAVWRCPEGKALYSEKLKKIYETVLKPIDWPARVVEVGTKLRTALEARDPNAAKEYQNQINTVRDQVTARIAMIGKQLGDVPKPAVFGDGGVMKVTDGWQSAGGAAAIDEVQFDGKATLHVRADGETKGSWRRALALPPGKYRFEANVRTAGVVATSDGSGEGAGVRISGGNRAGQNGAKGDTGWQTLKFEFEATGGEVLLVAELRASKGEVWFEKGSLRVVQVK